MAVHCEGSYQYLCFPMQVAQQQWRSKVTDGGEGEDVREGGDVGKSEKVSGSDLG